MAILLFIGPEGHRHKNEGGSGYNTKKDVVKLGPEASEIAAATNPLFEAAAKNDGTENSKGNNKRDKVIFNQLSTLTATPDKIQNSPEAQKIQARYQADLERALRAAEEKDKLKPNKSKPKK